MSLGAALPVAARDWIGHCHRHFFGWPGLARARNPHVVGPETALPAAALWRDRDVRHGLTALKRTLAQLGCSIPPLYRHYVDLCEPPGVKFLAFGTNPGSAGSVDGLIRLDLSELKPVRRARYLNAKAM